jgi:hypothetical protein
MAGTFRDKEEMDALIIEAVYPNDNREINATAMQALLLDMNETYYQIPDEENPSFLAWDPLETYDPGPNVYVIWSNIIYRLISLTASTGDQPDISPLIWRPIPASNLAHVQNTDIRLGVYGINYEAASATISIDLTALTSYNFIRLRKRTGSATITVQLRGKDMPVDDSPPRPGNPTPFIIYVDDFDNNTYLFSGGDFKAKNTITNTQSLTKGQFMQVRTYSTINEDPADPSVFVREEFSGKMSDGVADNPFDQDLNTTDSVVHAAQTLTQLADNEGDILITGPIGEIQARTNLRVEPADAETNPDLLTIPGEIYSPEWVGAEGGGDRALTVGEDGITKEEPLMAFSDVVLLSFKMIDNLGDTYEITLEAGEFVKTKIS